MSWNLALGAIACIFAISSLLSLFSSKRAALDNPIEGYLLAGASLGRPSVVSLLLSSSFGLNALLYAVWLGYSIGAWALVIQAGWALSFILIAPYSPKIHAHRSLHDLLGTRFDAPTRVIAGICSLVGMMYLMGWEVGIGNATLRGFLQFDGSMTVSETLAGAPWLAGGIVLGCLLYTVLGGLRGNASADKFMNLTKIFIVVGIMMFLFINFKAQTQEIGRAHV
jgi:Na+/proline symporter